MRRDFGHAVSSFITAFSGMKPNPSCLMWICCPRFPPDSSGASTWMADTSSRKMDGLTEDMGFSDFAAGTVY